MSSFHISTYRGVLVIIATLCMTLATLPVGEALAHANLTSSSIPPRSILTSSPATLTLTFSQETSPTETRVFVVDANNNRVDENDRNFSGETATVGLLPLSSGVYGAALTVRRIARSAPPEPEPDGGGP